MEEYDDGDDEEGETTAAVVAADNSFRVQKQEGPAKTGSVTVDRCFLFSSSIVSRVAA